jgi:ubiquinone/menaquinone biosynthesis C-methylase UbiE
MVAREGLRAHGLDISAEAIKLGGEALKSWGVSAKLTQGSMLEMPYKDASFDVVYDVLASFSLTTAELPAYLREARRVLKPGGRFFLFTLSAESDAFKNFAPAVKLDDWTLNGIHRKDSPYYGCFYPHRFDDPARLAETLRANGFAISSLETTDRTYNGGVEKLQCISVEAQKS